MPVGCHDQGIRKKRAFKGVARVGAGLLWLCSRDDIAPPDDDAPKAPTNEPWLKGAPEMLDFG